MQCLRCGVMTAVLQDVVPFLWFMIYKVQKEMLPSLKGSLLSMESVYSFETVVIPSTRRRFVEASSLRS